MNYIEMVNLLVERKLKLGMSEAHISMRSKISQPTVHRILSGKHQGAKFDDVMAIAKALGIKTQKYGTGIQNIITPISDMLDHQAAMLAIIITETMQGNSQLEGQGVDQENKKRIFEMTKAKLLAGPKSKLWLQK